MDGLGVEKDEAEGVKWYSTAAEKGHAFAEYSFAILSDKTELRHGSNWQSRRKIKG
jgi:TPR repeat protein